MKLWTMTSDDELELPLQVADTASELSKIIGVSANTIRSAVSHNRARGGHSIYHCIEVDEEGEKS